MEKLGAALPGVQMRKILQGDAELRGVVKCTVLIVGRIAPLHGEKLTRKLTGNLIIHNHIIHIPYTGLVRFTSLMSKRVCVHTYAYVPTCNFLVLLMRLAFSKHKAVGCNTLARCHLETCPVDVRTELV